MPDWHTLGSAQAGPAPQRQAPAVQVSLVPVQSTGAQHCAQVPVQSFSGATQAQTPDWHVFPPVQSPFPQQSLQVPAQSFWGVTQAQAPDWQVFPPVQSPFPQQAWQVPAQSFWPAGHWHAPATQVLPLVHAGPLPHLQAPEVQVSVVPVQSPFAQQLAAGMHTPRHSRSPALQLQAPLEQAFPAGHGPLVPHLQAPAVQVSVVPVQSALVQQSALGMQPAPQAFCPAGHWQTPATQVFPPRQSAAVPQVHVPAVQVSLVPVQSAFPQQLAAGMQVPAQSFCPAGHWHAPVTQVLPPVQAEAVPQAHVPAVHRSVVPVHSPLAQQFAAGMQPVPHARWPAGHWQAPATQTLPLLQAASVPHLQTPVLQVSVAPVHSALVQHAVFAMQVPAQSFWPTGQAQAPDWQVFPPEHSVFTQQFAVGMQPAPHCRVPGPQTQAPEEQTFPPVQAAPAPQVQAPAVQVSVAPVHSALAQQPPVATQVAPQSRVPAGQAQTLDWQVFPPVQSPVVQHPATGMHAGPQGLVPAGQSHDPAVQLRPSVQGAVVPHLQALRVQASPEGAHSAAVQHAELAMQAPSQSFWPVGQTQAPAVQTWPVAQAGAVPHLQTPAVQVSALDGQSAAVQQFATGMHPAPQVF